jgi:hypothetical protein
VSIETIADEQRRGKHLASLIQPTDVLTLFSGVQWVAVSQMTGRKVWQGYQDYVVSVRIPDSDWCIPVHCNAIAEVWRQGVQVYAVGQTTIQLEMFKDIA